MDELRVFVGTSPGGQDSEACEVLEHTLRRHASVRVELTRLHAAEHGPLSAWDSSRWATPWTAYRWAVPELCGFRGRAVYFDCPSLVFEDVGVLARAPMEPGASMLMRRSGRTLSTACIVFDCARAARFIPKLKELRQDVGAHQTVGHLLERRPDLVGPLPGNWGASDEEFGRHPRVGFESVHFERPHTQPHIPRARARLARAGKQHWFDGVALPHYCGMLVGLFEAEYAMMQKEAAE